MFGRTLETLMKAEVLEAGRPNRSSFRVQGKGRSWASGETKGNQTGNLEKAQGGFMRQVHVWEWLFQEPTVWWGQSWDQNSEAPLSWVAQCSWGELDLNYSTDIGCVTLGKCLLLLGLSFLISNHKWQYPLCCMKIRQDSLMQYFQVEGLLFCKHQYHM